MGEAKRRDTLKQRISTTKDRFEKKEASGCDVCKYRVNKGDIDGFCYMFEYRQPNCVIWLINRIDSRK